MHASVRTDADAAYYSRVRTTILLTYEVKFISMLYGIKAQSSIRMAVEEPPHKVRKLAHDSLLDRSQVVDEGSQYSKENADDNEFHSDSQSGRVNPETGDIQETHLESEDDSDTDNGGVSILPRPEETAPVVNSQQPHNHPDPTLSKSQQKKLRKKAEWESKREERKVVRKEKLLAKRARKREAKEQQQQQHAETTAPTETKPQQPTSRPVQLPITIVIDCDFDDLMRDNERISLASQITRSYSDNKNSLFRAHLTICSFGGKLKERFDTVLSHNYLSWRGVRVLDCDLIETAEKAKEWMVAEQGGGKLESVFADYANLTPEDQAKLPSQGEIVYLSSEADEDLTELKPYSTYIIGGLVDKNREKGVCYKRATKRGIKTARLPIGEFMDMQSRKVLATNHVNEIMVKWLECGNWGEAFMKVIPKRKGGKLKNGGGADEATPEAVTDPASTTQTDAE